VEALEKGFFFHADQTDYEFNDVIQGFCNGFENPKIRTSGDIIKYNEEHAEIAMPQREFSELISPLEG
jgi:hypothetical protein